ncbi:hypothetical protein ACI2L1_04765 [Streptomyces sp. NPDC019531]|uniref:hypothetical protein n=1 Tax=Streptomyces sp. NPDC019531 TaxID=3365062 RepID=UPI00384EEA23
MPRRPQHAILEHNISVDVATSYKRSSRDGIRRLAARLSDPLPLRGLIAETADSA